MREIFLGKSQLLSDFLNALGGHPRHNSPPPSSSRIGGKTPKQGAFPFDSTSLKVETDGASNCARRDVVRAAERGQKVVGRDFVGQVDYLQPGTPLIAIAVDDVVVPQ